MEYKEKRKRSSRFHRLKKIATCSIMVISIPFLLCSCWMLVYFAGRFHAKDIADAMWPSPYPNATLIRDYKGGASCCVWTGKVYCTIDSIDIVLDFYKQYSSDENYHLYQSDDKEFQSYSISYSKLDEFLDFVTQLSDGDGIGAPELMISISQDESRIDDCVQGTLINIRLDIPSP